MPEEKPDVLKNDRTGERETGLILSASEDTILFRRTDASSSKRLPAADYTIVRWAGVTDAADLLEQGKRFLRKADEHIRECQQNGPLTNSKTIVLSNLQQAQETLGRIKREAAQPYRDAAELLNRYDSWELTRRLDEAEAVYEVAHELRNEYSTLEIALHGEGWAGVPTHCGTIEASLREIERQAATEASRKAIGKIRAGVKALQEAAARIEALKETGGLAAEPEQLPPRKLLDTAAQMDDAVEKLDGVVAVSVFPSSVDAQVKRRRRDLAETRQKMEVFVEEARRLADTESRIDALGEAVRQNPDQKPYQVAQSYESLAAEIEKLQTSLRAANDPPGRYALAHVSQLLDRVRKEEMASLVACHTYAVQKALVPPESLEMVSQAYNAGYQASDLLRSVQALLSRDLSDQQKQDVLALIARIKERQVDYACRKLEIEVNELQQQLGTVPRDQTASALAARIEGNERLAEHFKELAARAGTVAKDMPGSEAGLDRILRQLAAVGVQMGNEHKILEVLLDVSSLPESIRRREQLSQAEQLLAKDDGLLAALPAKGGSGLNEIYELAVARADEAKKRLKATVALVDGLEMERGIEGRFATAEDALDQGKYRAVRTDLRLLSDSLRELRGLVDGATLAGDDASLSLAPQRHAERLAGLESRLEREITTARRNAGWIPLPIKNAPLAAPEPENRLLEIDFLLGTMRLDEAEEKLAEATAAMHDPETVARLQDLRTQATFLKATSLETGGNLAEAKRLYEQLAADTEEGHPLAAAASSAISRLETRLRADQAQQSNRLRLMIVILAGAVGLGLASLLFWRDSASVRLRRAERELRAAAAYATDGQATLRNLRLERAAQLLSRFPQDDVRAAQLRRRLSQPERLPSRRRDVDLSPTPPQSESVVDRLLALSEPDPASAAYCLDWLASRAGNDPGRRAQVVEWLKQNLAPSIDMTDEDLWWRVRCSRSSGEILRGEVWPRVYEVCGLWWLKKTDEIAASAEKVDLARLEEIERPDLCLVLARSLMHVARWQDALHLLKRLEHADGRTAAEARRWRSIVVAAAKAQRAEAPQLDVAEALLQD